MIMAKCTGLRCPMQVGYKVDECDYKDCPWRTEPITNADRIRVMNDFELAAFWVKCKEKVCDDRGVERNAYEELSEMLIWLQQPAE